MLISFGSDIILELGPLFASLVSTYDDTSAYVVF